MRAEKRQRHNKIVTEENCDDACRNPDGRHGNGNPADSEQENEKREDEIAPEQQLRERIEGPLRRGIREKEPFSYRIPMHNQRPFRRELEPLVR